jgi:small-conductance mechanosensitive channel
MESLIRTIFTVPTAFAQTEKASAVASETANQLQSLFNSIITAVPLWITGFIVIVASFILARIVKSAIENKMTAAGLEEEHKEIQIVTGRAASAAVITLGVTIGLKIAGIDITAIIAAAAFGIGFAMRDIIMNFLAGIIVLLQKQFTIGDWIKVKGTTGIVKEIQSRYTVIKKFDGTKVIIPNGDLFKNQVTNLTGNPFRRFQIDLGVDLYYDLKETINLVYGSINKVTKILKTPKPSIIVTQPGSFYNNLRIRCWVDSKKGVLKPISSLVRQMHKDFYSRGWSWPYPVQNVYFDKEMPPDIITKAKEYMEKNQKKKALHKTNSAQAVTEIASGTVVGGRPIMNAQAANPPIVIQKIDAGPDSNKINISEINAPPMAATPPMGAPLMTAPPMAQSVAPAWLQNAARTLAQPQSVAPSEVPAAAVVPQIPMGIAIQPQSQVPEPVIKLEIPMGVSPQPVVPAEQAAVPQPIAPAEQAAVAQPVATAEQIPVIQTGQTG